MKAIYQDVAKKMRQYFLQFPEGKRLPGCTHLMERYQINRQTVVKALHELEAQGVISIEKRRGTFLRRQKSVPVFHRAAIIGVAQETPIGIFLRKELKRRGYAPISIQFDEDAFENNPRGLLNFPVDGYLFRFARSFTRKQAEVFRNSDRAAVSLSCLPGCDWIDFYPQNTEAAMTLALRKLHEAGHRRIVWVSTMRHEDYRPKVEEHLKCFRQLQGNDFRDGDCLIFPWDAGSFSNRPFSPRLLTDALAKLRQSPEPPTALLLGSGNEAGMIREFLPELGKEYSYAAILDDNKLPPAYLSCTVSDVHSRVLHAVERLVCRMEGGTPPAETVPGEVSWQPGETIRPLF